MRSEGGCVADLPSKHKIRASWESESLFADAVRHVGETPFSEIKPETVEELRATTLASLTKGYGETIANAVIAAADGYFDDEYPPTLRAWWMALAREVRGRSARDDRALRRVGIGSLGRVIL